MIRRAFTDGLVWLWLASAIIGAALVLSVPARADDMSDAAWMWIQHHGPEFCAALDKHPDATGVTIGASPILGAGFTPDEVGLIAVWSTLRFCPDHMTMLKRLAAQAGRQQYA